MTDYSYLTLFDEAQSMVIDELYAGNIIDLISNIYTEDYDYDEWMTSLGHVLANDRMLVDRMARAYMKIFNEKIHEKLDEER